MDTAPSIREIKAYLAFKLVPKRLHPFGVTWDTTQKFRRHVNQFKLEDNGSLYYCKSTLPHHDIQILEDSERLHAFTEAHGKEHTGYRQICKQFENHYFWPGMRKDIKKWIEECDICQEIKRKRILEGIVVMTDHNYCFNSNPIAEDDISQSSKSTTLKPETEKSLKTSSSNNDDGDEAMQEEKENAKESSAKVPGNKWDHDYVPDALTFKRRLHTKLEYDRPKKQRKVERLQLTAVDDNSPQMPRAEVLQDAKELAWLKLRPVRLKVEQDTNFLPSFTDAAFTTYLGLEHVVGMQQALESGNFPVDVCRPPNVCTYCRTDVSPTWLQRGDKRVVCASCSSLVRMRKRSTVVKEHLKAQILQVSAGLREGAQTTYEHDLTDTKIERLANMSICDAKANRATLYLLKQKGFSFANDESGQESNQSLLSPSRAFLKKIRIMSYNRLKEARALGYRKPPPSEVIQALRNKREFEKYLAMKLYVASEANTQRRVVFLKAKHANRQPVNVTAVRRQSAVDKAKRNFMKYFSSKEASKTFSDDDDQSDTHEDDQWEKRPSHTVKLKKWSKAKETSVTSC